MGGSTSLDCTRCLEDEVDELADLEKENIQEQFLGYARFGCDDKLKEILQANPLFVNLTRDNGWTPLHAAAQNNHISTTMLLLEGRANANPRTKEENSTPLYLAASFNAFEVVRCLLQKGSDFSIASNTNATPLLVATRHNYVETVTVLLSCFTKLPRHIQALETAYATAEIYSANDVKEVINLKLEELSFPWLISKRLGLPSHVAAVIVAYVDDFWTYFLKGVREGSVATACTEGLSAPSVAATNVAASDSDLSLANDGSTTNPVAAQTSQETAPIN